MALGYTLVDFGELEGAIKQLEKTKNDLGNQLKKIKGIIDNSVDNPEIYFSEDARITKEQFEDMYNRWAVKFDNYVQEYIDYFKKVKEIYEGRGKTEARNAQQLNSFID
ncbi:MAG: hypothetical protein OSJ43_15240 [Oscillospiraceae bacterium]|nr:hypothetical protein [Oscillospiraceae bacterium]